MAEGQVLNLSLKEFMDSLADPTPTPGGGGVAALAGALGCAMARMVAAYARKREPAVAPLAEKLGRADLILRRLLAEDIAAYQDLTEATRAAKADPSSADERVAALVTATMVPLEMAAVAVTALATMDELKGSASKWLISDLGVAAEVALAGVRAAGYSVRVNVREMTDTRMAGDLARQLDDLTGRAVALAASVTGFVDRALQNRAD